MGAGLFGGRWWSWNFESGNFTYWVCYKFWGFFIRERFVIVVGASKLYLFMWMRSGCVDYVPALTRAGQMNVWFDGKFYGCFIVWVTNNT